jgi:response regulator RpfG family c-di-GMP phosphodiesterase
VQAKKSYLSGVRLFEGAKLPEETVATLEHFYERFDGEGFPDRLTGKEIPLGSRIVALVETYCDLTTHAKNPYRKVLSPNEACEVLVRYKGTFFDPNLVDVFRSVMLGDEFKSRLLADRPTIVICDKDPEENTVLEVRLVEQGFEVVVSRDPGNALERIAQGDVDALITEIDLEPIDGFELVTLARTHREGLPVVFLSSRADADSVNRGFDLGRADYLVKPTSPDVIGAKLRMLLAQNPAPQKKSGVSGSLREMSLPDVLQILANGRKSGRLELESDGQRGELLFSDGAIWDARLGGKRGEEAVYAMLLFEDGSFTLDPDRKPTERMIHGSTEGLLLEGMRRLDEGRR